ncbi:protein kinase-like domain-containing protein [Artemisia annua]|uniref:Protein kinase-like domain-containing protein n=1 Tax=Artemisia annua TaxID=35608 RepID=A0A2U1LYC7_ARTAN|nr:protein kinase-like domain-containing protein [Artemisia annua]
MSILQELDHLRIPLEDIKQATNNFARENEIGPGGYGIVYKGELLRSEGLVKIAAKRVDQRYFFAEKHFLNEIAVLSTYRHANIVSLIGFCDEHDDKILVEYFVAYGSLDRYLSSAKLTWLKRLQICLEAARGLNHLHQGSLDGQTSVLHRDVRSRTILLDKNWQAKIGGFGLSMIGPMQPAIFVDDGFVEPGYVDPTYLQTGVLTKESDVYSFGVVLFEVLCGRVASERNGNNKQYLGPVARLHYREQNLNNLIDPILREQMSPDSLEVFSKIAYQCLEKNRTVRPTMTEIVQGLIKVLRIQQDFVKALALQKKYQVENDSGNRLREEKDRVVDGTNVKDPKKVVDSAIVKDPERPIDSGNQSREEKRPCAYRSREEETKTY